MSKHDKLFNSLRKRVSEAADSDDLALKAEIIAGMRFPKQQALAEDPNRFIAASCGRQCGKSTGSLTIALEPCLKKNDQIWCIIGLTRPSIKSIYWRVLKKLNQDLQLHIQFNETELTAEFSNGSYLKFLGAENASEIEKIRGNNYDGVIIDECKSFNINVFDDLIGDVIKPTLAARTGKLILIGTPGSFLIGEFYKATAWPSPTFKDPVTGEDKPFNIRYNGKKHNAKWSSHHWDARDNIPNPQIWADFEREKRDNGWADDNPRWCREYLGLWVVDGSNRVFRYDPQKNNFNHEFAGPHGLPDGHEWNFVLGLDPGFDDAFGFAVAAYSPTHPTLYNVFSMAEPGLNVTNAAKMIKELEKEYGGFEVMVGDRAGLGKMIFAELAELHDLYIERTEKKEKEDIIELMNDDMDAVPPRVRIEDESKLAIEMALHKWEYQNGKRVESDKTKNDACDAWVYAYRWCEHKRFKPKQVKTQEHSAQWYAELEQREIEAEIARYNAPKDFLDGERL